MPTPHGHHGLAFGTHEVKVLRRALMLAMKSGRNPESKRVDASAQSAPAPVDFWLLDKAIAEAEAERDRLRAFELAELVHQRTALPGTAATYLTALEHAVAAHAYIPTAEDLAALRSLAEQPCGAREQGRREGLLAHCTALAEGAMEMRLAEKAARREAPIPLNQLVP